APGGDPPERHHRRHRRQEVGDDRQAVRRPRAAQLRQGRHGGGPGAAQGRAPGIEDEAGPMTNALLQILYEDNHCLAVAKPAALLTQGVPAGIVTLESLVKDCLRERHGKAGRVYLGIPHRLDRPVSGVVLFARQTKSAQRLAEQFQQRQVTKVYWAVVEGRVEPTEGVWEDWLLKVSEEARSAVATPDAAGAKPALTAYRTLAALEDCTVLEMRPQT